MQTIENLAKAFVGESQARNRYTYYAKTAQNESLFQISEIFTITADNEREHAKWFLRMMNNVMEKTGAKPPVIVNGVEVPNVMAKTPENLKAAIIGENFEYSSLYPKFVETAEKDGFPDVAFRIRAIIKAEMHHEDRYKKALASLEAGTLFKKEFSTPWVCSKCGYVHEGPEAPAACPSCGHPKEYFQIKCETY